MDKYILIFFGFSLISCNLTQNKTETTSINTNEINQNFDWLLGEWKRNHEEEGKETFEIWEKINENKYIGQGFTLQKGDTIFQENMSLIKSDKLWDLSVKMSNEAETIEFKGTSFSETEFTCENTTNEFPTSIKYWIDGELLKAAVSNDEMTISFEFEKIKSSPSN